ncbi:MAG: hypothetical protein ABIR59_02025 [Gemmatimonadales bacterium]
MFCRVWNRVGFVIAAIAGTGVPTAPLIAQAPAAVTGIVRSQSGAPLLDARVTHGAGDGTSTDVQGRFRLLLPAGIPSVIAVRAVGYTPLDVPITAIASGASREIAVTMRQLFVLDAVTVVAGRTRPLLNTEDAAIGGALEEHELQALPTDARDALTLAFNIPGVAQGTGFFGDAPPLSLAGGNSLYSQYFVDGLNNTEGFLGGPRVELPLGGLRRLEVLTSTYGVSHGPSAYGVINQETRPGGSGWRGDVFAMSRPGRNGPLGISFDAVPKRLPAGVDPDGFQRVQLGASAAGPISHGTTFGSGALEYSSEDEARIGSTAQTQFTGVERRQKIRGFGRIDHGWTPTQTTTLRVAYSNTDRAGAGSGLVVPEADITTRRIGSLTALTHRMALRGGRASNTVSAQYGTFRWYFPPTRSDFTRPQVTILAPDSSVQAIVGSSNFVFDETERQLELRNVFESVIGGGHTIRAGAEATRSWFQLSGASTNPNGSYTVFNDGNIQSSGEFLSIIDVPTDVRVLRYTIDANQQQVDLTQTLVGAYVEDQWRVTPSLAVVAGIRWDYDDITSRGASSPDLDNFQPRLSVNWYRTPTTVIRAGAGVYTGKLPYAIYSDAVQFGPDGNAVVSFDGANAPAFGRGLTREALQARRDQLPPHEERALFPLGLSQPLSYQASVGFQAQLGTQWAVTVDATWVETRNLPRSVDLNAITRPIGVADSVARDVGFGDSSRPVPPSTGSFRRLTATQSAGRGRYQALVTTVRRQLGQAWSVDGNWVWSRAQNDTEDINFNATQANCFGADFRDAITGSPCSTSEWADAINDRRHKVTLRGVYTAGSALRLAAIGDWQAGQPVNRVAGRTNADGSFSTFDLDGSGPIFGEGFVGNLDRFVGVGRNDERLPNFLEISAGATYLLGVGANLLELRADVFNVFNATEWGNYANGVPGGGSRTQAGRPGDPIVLRSPGRPRQVQLSARYVF